MPRPAPSPENALAAWRNQRSRRRRRGTSLASWVTDALPETSVDIARAMEDPSLSASDRRVLALLDTLGLDEAAAKADVPTAKLVAWINAPFQSGGLDARLHEAVRALDALALGTLARVMANQTDPRAATRAAEILLVASGRNKGEEQPSGSGVAVQINNLVGGPDRPPQPLDTYRKGT